MLLYTYYNICIGKIFSLLQHALHAESCNDIVGTLYYYIGKLQHGHDNYYRHFRIFDDYLVLYFYFILSRAGRTSTSHYFQSSIIIIVLQYYKGSKYAHKYTHHYCC